MVQRARVSAVPRGVRCGRGVWWTVSQGTAQCGVGHTAAAGIVHLLAWPLFREAGALLTRLLFREAGALLGDCFGAVGGGGRSWMAGLRREANDGNG